MTEEIHTKSHQRVNGKLINLDDFSAYGGGTLTIEDCIQHLAGIHRYAGVGPLVLDHSIVLAESFLHDPNWQLATARGLSVLSGAHDLAESISGDMPGPVKRRLAARHAATATTSELDVTAPATTVSPLAELESEIMEHLLLSIDPAVFCLTYGEEPRYKVGDPLPLAVRRRDREICHVERRLMGWWDHDVYISGDGGWYVRGDAQLAPAHLAESMAPFESEGWMKRPTSSNVLTELREELTESSTSSGFCIAVARARGKWCRRALERYRELSGMPTQVKVAILMDLFPEEVCSRGAPHPHPLDFPEARIGRTREHLPLPPLRAPEPSCKELKEQLARSRADLDAYQARAQARINELEAQLAGET